MAPETNEMLIDELLPEFDATIIEHVVVDAPPDVVFRTTREMDFMQIRSPITDAAMFARTLPSKIGRVFGREEAAPPTPPAMRLSDMFDEGSEAQEGLAEWVGLGEAPGRELVFGSIGKVWKPNIEWAHFDAADFRDFDDLGYAKIAAGFSVRSYGAGRTLLSYEARTEATDAEARDKFLRYWGVVRRFVSPIMRGALSTVKSLAEEEVAGAEGDVDLRDTPSAETALTPPPGSSSA